MKIIYNNIIPFNGYKAINIFGLIFARKDSKKLTEEQINHEAIHTAQMKELLYIPFYLWYCVEYIIKRWSRTQKEAYHDISFEREAYDNEENMQYLSNRKHYSWFKRIKK